MPFDYININKAAWDRKVDIHYQSDFYDVKGFIAGNCSLNTIELDLLENVKGKKILHLQCHFGQDSISLARKGAIVTGVDFSTVAIEKAKELAIETNVDINFICSNIYDVNKHIDEEFDIVFTSYGTICWLPDLSAWANIISHYLKPNGKFVFADFHPVVWMFDDEFKHIKYCYFKSDPVIEIEEGTYAEKNAEIKQENITWNHGIGEVLNGLIAAGIQIQQVKEYDYSPYNCFNETIEVNPSQYRIKHLKNKIPMVYSVLGIKSI